MKKCNMVIPNLQHRLKCDNYAVKNINFVYFMNIVYKNQKNGTPGVVYIEK